MSRFRRFSAVAAAISAAVLISACGGGDSTETSTGGNSGPNDSGPVVAVISDVSVSTKPERVQGGTYEQGWMDTARATAAARGSLWASAADGQTLANSSWLVNGYGFKDPQVGSDLLKDAALKKQADELQPKAREILSVNRNGSDLLGALFAASRLYADYPDRDRALVLLTDGGITTGGINIAKNLPTTDAERTQAIQRLKKNGQLADLTGGSGEPV